MNTANLSERSESAIVHAPKTDSDLSRLSKLSKLSFPTSYSKVAESLTTLGVKVNENSLKGRWLKNYIEPALEGVDCPLWKKDGITEFGFNAIAEILQRCVLAGDKNISPQTLRNELIERYGLELVKESISIDTKILDIVVERVYKPVDLEALKKAVRCFTPTEPAALVKLKPKLRQL